MSTSRESLGRRANSGSLAKLSDELRDALLRDNPQATEQQRLALRDPRVSFVITGQQLGVYGGPLLTLYKALHTIKLARELAASSGAPVLPLFWLQAEDHDVDEIASVSFPASQAAGEVNAAAPLIDTFALNIDPWGGKENRRAVGALRLPDTVRELTDRVVAALPTREGECWLAPAIRAAYTPGASFIDAFRGVFDAMLGSEAILYFNPLLPESQAAAVPIYRRALARYLEVEAALESAKEDAQVHVRARSPLFFYHPEGRGGPRFRMEAREGEVFHAVGGTIELSMEALEAAIGAANGSVSASALLRPLIQDAILPSVCYIGGQAEVRYFEQVALVAPVLELAPPICIARARFLLVDAKASRLAKQLGLTLSEATLPLSQLKELLTEKQLGESAPALFAKMRTSIDAALFEPLDLLKRVDGEAEQQLRRAQDKIARAIDGLEERFSKSAAAALGRDSLRLSRLRALLRPNELPQERVVGSIWFAAQCGPSLVATLLEQLDPLSGDDAEQVVQLN